MPPLIEAMVSEDEELSRTGWPLGLEAMNIRAQIIQGIGATEPDPFLLATPSFSSLSSSDFDSESSRSFFQDRSITLGTLMGIHPTCPSTTYIRSSHACLHAEMHRCVSTRARPRPRSHPRRRQWKSLIGCIAQSNPRIDDSVPTLGQFLEEQKGAGVSFIGSSDDKLFINVMSEENQHDISTLQSFFLDDHGNSAPMVNSNHFSISELAVIEEDIGGDFSDSSSPGEDIAKIKHCRTKSNHFCLPKVSDLLVKMSPSRYSQDGKFKNL